MKRLKKQQKQTKNNNNQEREKHIETSKYCNKVNPNKASTVD
jgi:glycerol-3-phosphate cytidylyltransferase-like family protein